MFTLVRRVLVSFPRKLVMIDFRLKFHLQINVIKAMQNGLELMGHGKELSVPQCEVHPAEVQLNSGEIGSDSSALLS